MMIFLQFLILATIGCVMAGEVPPEMQELARELHNGCVAETGVAESLIDAARKGDFADDRKLHCFFRCGFQQMGTMSEEGDIDPDVFEALLPPALHNLLPDIRICAGKMQGTDLCERALNFNKCLQAADPVGFMII